MSERITNRYIPALALLLVGSWACNGSEQGTVDQTAQAAPAPRRVVDSVIPMDEALRRFRGDLKKPDGLHGGTTSREALVEQVVGALVLSDTAAFEDMAVDMAEWSWLYYPYDKLSKPPYELPPGIAWLQLQETNRKGVLRALRELGGHEIDLLGYTCDPEPEVEGYNKLWSGCRITLSRDGADPVTLPLFGAILERDGRFKILSYNNDF